MFFYKQILNITLGAYLAAFLCFFAAYTENKKDKTYENLYEYGTNVNSTIQKKSNFCGNNGRSWFNVLIENTNQICYLKTTIEVCESKKIGDTILVRFLPGIDKCTVAKYNIGKYGNDYKWINAVMLLIGFGVLISDFIKNKKQKNNTKKYDY